MTRILTAVAWPYANGPRHIGHVAGFGVPSDVYSRYMRMAGHDVLMVSGTDEHGTPILVQAEQEGVSPRELADRYNRMIVEDLHALGLSYDLFTRTTTVNHYTVAQELFRTDYANGYMIEQTTTGAVSPSTGRTLPDRYIEGTCPICGYENARGDQCDNCGNQLDPADLINPKSKVNGETPKFVETTHFFLDLPALADALGEWLRTRTDWRPNVLKFSLNLLDDLKPRAMTRDIDWGIPVPLPGWEENSHKRLYVWFDAVVGYLSASIEWARRTDDPEQWRKWWNDSEAVSNYFMGKDNITFHSQIWPAELLAYAGKGAKGGQPGPYGELNLPTEVVSSEFLTMEGKQFSSSRGVVIYVRDILSRYQPDALRYFICAAGPENQDTDFTWAEFVRRTNDELVAGWGNLVNRTASLINKNLGEIPEAGELQSIDLAVLETTKAGFGAVGELLASHKQKAALAEAMRVVGEVNKYLSDTEPWKLKKTDFERMKTVLHVAAQAINDCRVLLSPFLPHSSQLVFEAFGGTGTVSPLPEIREVDDLDGGPGYPVLMGNYTLGETVAAWESAPIVPGTPVPAPSPIFRKLDESVIEEELARLADKDK
ncbi:methionine--tRNA ligase [Kineosporia sp. NBRC 101731]|uniref:methionine--tRNA ligase n=1 Tax=Kineosporia sp. NBRC 101731 TaxID=3032199 RepID=UPI00249FF287|nr:methionine--tRNA ligase [Kineosporia sp. NBRC 101731]GLY28718.1 methionine--tRNA ligase [Kineosporia sp. NBRC 101731]